MKNLIKNYKIILITAISVTYISTSIFAYDIYCSNRYEGRLCNYRGYPGGQCTLLDANQSNSYCGLNGEKCYCSQPDYVVE